MLSMPFVVALLTRKYSMDGGRPAVAAVPKADEWYSGPRYTPPAATDAVTYDAIVTKNEYRDRSDTASTASTSASHDLFYLPRRRADDDVSPMMIPEEPIRRDWRNVFERLYQPDYHQKRDARLAEMRERLYTIKCSFRPAIKSYDASSSEDVVEAEEEPATVRVVERLYSPTYHQDRLRRLEAKRAALYDFKSPPSGSSSTCSTVSCDSLPTRLYSSTYFEERGRKLEQLQVQLEIDCTFTPAINQHTSPPRKPLYDPEYHQRRSSILLMMQDRQLADHALLRRSSSVGSSTRRHP
ncbi:hypothetical protein ACHHYP_04579 [Achlya hypogyna]|uniref:Uncharacterized protein n=1 Tax=Achlya hypogyna TaxID=1202772 RepID=A0A1V9Z0S3_ACHHY|nr:hypothetical protein ACHHYP_04579 [Achlya hypogyna]